MSRLGRQETCPPLRSRRSTARRLPRRTASSGRTSASRRWSRGRARLRAAPFPLTMKLEQLQHAGSFKTRGAFANLLVREGPAGGRRGGLGRQPRRGGGVRRPAARRPGENLRADGVLPGEARAHPRLRRRAVVMGERYADALAESEAGRGAGALPIHAFDQERDVARPGPLGPRAGPPGAARSRRCSSRSAAAG